MTLPKISVEEKMLTVVNLLLETMTPEEILKYVASVCGPFSEEHIEAQAILRKKGLVK